MAKLLKEGQQLRSEQAEAIWQGMGEVTRSLRKAGYVEPKVTHKAKPAPTPLMPPQEAAIGEPSAPDVEYVRKLRTAEVKTSATPESGQPE